MSQPADTARDMASDQLREGLVTWATVDTPWLQVADEERFERSQAALEKMMAAQP